MEDKQVRVDFALGLIGDIKKAFQKEQKRLKGQGVEIRFKPVWQAIHNSIWSLKTAAKKSAASIEEEHKTI